MSKLLFKFLSVTLGLILFNASYAQINYTRSTFTGAYSPITIVGGATTVPYSFGTAATRNNQTASISLPFTINFNGTTYDNTKFLAICINGFAMFSNTSVTTPSAATNTNLFGTGTPNSTLAPWFDDLDLDINDDLTNEGEVMYQVVAPDELVVQWTNVWAQASSSGSIANSRQINFQLKLYGNAHSSKANQIEFIYGGITGAYNSAESASIGIENATGGANNFLDAVTNSKIVSNSMMNTNIWPKQHYRFTPSTTPAVALPAGTYTVGSASGSDYPSLYAAFCDLNIRGAVAGTVTFNLTDAVYDTSNNIFPLILGPISGTSATNRIIIQGTLPGGATLSSIGGTGSIGHETTVTALGESTVLALLGTDYVKLKNLTLEAHQGSPLVDRGLIISNSSAINGATFDSVVNVTVRLNRLNMASTGIVLQTATAPTIAGGANSNNKFLNIRVYNSYCGMLLSNTTTAANNFPDNNNEIGNSAGDSTVIGDNTPGDIGGGADATYGIRASNQLGLKIHHTIVRNISHNGTTTVDGIWTDGTTTVSTSCEIYNNKVYNITQNSTSTSGGVVNGMRIGLTNNAVSNSKVYNNFITGLNSVSPGSASTASRRIIGIQATGITTAGSVYTHNIDFNTVVINPDVAISSNTCLQIAGPATTLTTTYNVRNNIFANYTGSQSGIYKHYCWVSPLNNSIGAGSISNRNVLYIANPDNGYVGLGNTTDFALLANWKTIASGVDANSRSENPQLISLADYKINPSVATPVESAGSFFSGAITWASNDMEGTARHPSTPDIGAKEGVYTAFFDDDMSPAEFTSPANMDVILTGASISPVVRFKNNGVNAQSNVTVRYRIIGPAPANTVVYNQTATIASLSSGSTVLTTFTAGSVASPGTYTLEAITELGADNSKTNDTLRVTVLVSDPLSGVIAVGNASAFPFNTLTNAVKAINSVGVSAATTFSLTDALYGTNESFPIEIKQFAGSGSSNTLTIKPATGNTAAIQGKSIDFMLRITDADYVTIDGSNTMGGTTRNLSIINDSATANSGAIWISSSANGATFNTVKNTLIKAGINSTTTTYGIYVAGATISTSGTGANNDNLVIQNNLVQRAYRGIFVRGTATGLLDNTLITQNEVGSAIPDDYVFLKGIEVANAVNMEISQNKVYNLKPASSAAIGIELGTNVSIARVHRNIIDSVGSTGTSATGAYGIALTNTTGIDSVLIYNNFVTDIASLTGGTGVLNVINGIRVAGGTRIYVDNNTVSLRGTYGGNSASAALMATVNSIDGLYVRNNILINNLTNVTTTAKSYAIYTALGVVLNEVNNNVYFTSGSNSGLAFIDGTDKPNMNLLRAATGQDNASFRYSPAFVSVKDLHIPNATASAVESVGKPLAHVTGDIDGNTRTATPDIGADEFNGTPLDITGPGINYTLSIKTSIINNLSFTAAISDNSGVNSSTAKPRVYYKKSTDNNSIAGNSSFDNGWKYTEATNSSSPFSFTIDYSLLSGGSVTVGDVIQYFVVAEDLATVPNVGVNGAEFAATPASVVLSPADFPVTIGNSYKIAPAIGNVVQVGAGHTYTSLTNTGGLFEAINNGVITGNTTVLITSNLSETGTVALTEFVEDGAGNYTITFRPDAAATREIRGTTGANTGLIRINGTDRLVFDGRFNGAGNYLTFVNGSTAARATVFYFKNDGTSTNTSIPGSEYITIRNCNIVGGTRNQSSDTYNGPYGIVFSNDISSATVLGAAFGNTNLSIIQNKFSLMAIGLYCNTHSATPLYNAVIDSNQFGHAIDDSTMSSQGMLIGNIPDGKIRRNVFTNMLQSHPTLSISGSIYGMQIYGQSHRAEIGYNTLRKFRNYEAGGIYGISISSGDSVLVHDNLIYGFESNSSGSMSVMGINPSLSIVLIYHNTVNFYPKYMNGTNGSACLYTSSSPSKIYARNNNFVNTTVGTSSALPAAMYFLGSNFGNSDYNNLYAPNGHVARISASYATLADWRAAFGADMNSLSVNPQLNNDSNLVLLPTTTLNGKGTYLSAVPRDFIGDLRANPPTIGAYEKPADASSPVILYNKLVNTTVNSQRVLTNFATITDVGTAVDTVPGRKPRLYFKRKTDDNTFNDNTPGTPGWKFAEASNSSSPFSFVMDYSSLFGGPFVTTSDTMQYFVIAQDTAATPNIGVNSAIFATNPSSVNLNASHFPAYGSINYYLITNPLSGALFVGPGSYPSLTDHGGAFELLNNSAIAGPIELYITSNTTETGIHALNSLSETGIGNYTVRVIPVGNVELSGNTSTAMIRINGADRVVFDGTYSGSRGLTLTNNGSGSVLELGNQSHQDTIINVNFKGNTSLVDEGLLSIKNNSDSAYIINNKFTLSSLLPTNAIYAGGTTGTNDAIQVVSNEITNFASSGIYVAATGNGSNWKINNNNFYYDHTTTATTSQTAINFLAGATSENDSISYNHIGGQAINAGGNAWTNAGAATVVNFKGISVNAGGTASNIVVSDNTIRNIKLTGTTAMAFTGIEQVTGSGNLAITSNTIGDSLNADSIVIYSNTSTTINCGILSNSASQRMISNNKIWGITAYGTLNNNLIGISVSGNGRPQLISNTIYNLFSAGNESSETVARSVTGIYSGSDNKDQVMRKNHISKLLNTAGSFPSGSAATIVRAIMVNSTNSGGQISQNRIENIENSSSGNGEIHGVYFFTGASNARWTIDNNVIHLTNGSRTNSVRIEGVHDRNAAANREIALVNNTIYIGGSVASGTAGSACYQRIIASTHKLENNIFYNERTGGSGKHVAMSNLINPPTANWTSASSNYNLFVAPDTAAIIEWGVAGTGIAPDDYKVSAASDQFSYFASNISLPSFNLFNGHVSGDLSINLSSVDAWAVNGKGKAIDTLGYSFDDSSRSVTLGIPVDIGAYEFTPFTLPPATQNLSTGSGTDIVYLTRKLATITYTSGVAPFSVDAQYFSGVTPPSAVNGKKINSYTSMVPQGGASQVFNISYAYSPAEISNVPQAGLKLARSINNGSSYVYYGSSVVNTTQFTVTATGVNDFGIFTLTDQSNPLPVTLASFNATALNKNVLVSWTTSNEKNVSHFIVEVSADGKHFEQAGQVKANGNSSVALDYRFTHADAQLAMNNATTLYYRLITVDNDRNSTTSKTAMVRFDGKTMADAIVVYPNPFSNNITLSVPSASSSQATVSIFDIQGRMMKTRSEDLLEGMNTIRLDELDELKSGIYFIRLETGNESRTIKVVKQ